MKIEINNGTGQFQNAGLLNNKIDVSEEVLQKIVESVESISESINKKINDIDNKPNSIEIKYGINVDLDANVLISKATFGSNFEIKLKWER